MIGDSAFNSLQVRKKDNSDRAPRMKEELAEEGKHNNGRSSSNKHGGFSRITFEFFYWIIRKRNKFVSLQVRKRIRVHQRSKALSSEEECSSLDDLHRSRLVRSKSTTTLRKMQSLLTGSNSNRFATKQ